MSFPVVDELYHPLVSQETSGYSTLQQARDMVITLLIPGTTISKTTNRRPGEFVPVEQTSSGFVVTDETITPSAAIAELRRRSGLTWDQLARLFGVSRRSIHFWASGEGLSAVNEERLGRMLAVIRYFDRGNAQVTRSVLMTPLDDAVIPFDLLANDKFNEVMERLGAGLQRSMPALGPLSVEARWRHVSPMISKSY